MCTCIIIVNQLINRNLVYTSVPEQLRVKKKLCSQSQLININLVLVYLNNYV